MPSDKIKALTLTSLSAAGFDGLFQPINPLGCEGACSIIRINNATNKSIFISYDAINTHEFMTPGQVIEIEAQQESQPSNKKCLFQKGMIVYAFAPAVAGTGSVYLSGYYQN